MNPRIQELAERAGFSYMPSNYPDMADLYKCADFELEKFAELIVQECAGIELYWLNEQDRKAVAEKIKEHFGVEK